MWPPSRWSPPRTLLSSPKTLSVRLHEDSRLRGRPPPDPDAQLARRSDQLPLGNVAAQVAITVQSVAFTLVGASFSDVTTSMMVPDGGSVTKVIDGVGQSCTFSVFKATVRRGDECSVVRRITVR